MKSILPYCSSAAVGGALLVGTSAHAALIGSTSYGGNTYELWEAPGISWIDARDAAVAGGGYLAVLSDAAETTAVYGALIGTGFFSPTAGQAGQAWLGAVPADGSGSTLDASNWAWITGEAWNAFAEGNFGAGEPNGDSQGLTVNRYGTSEWNDEGGYVGGYLVERSSASVPDAGSSGLLLASGALLLIAGTQQQLRRTHSAA